MKISRLELLKLERARTLKMNTLAFGLMLKCRDYFDHEIECIEKHGSANPIYDIEEGELN